MAELKSGSGRMPRGRRRGVASRRATRPWSSRGSAKENLTKLAILRLHTNIWSPKMR